MAKQVPDKVREAVWSRDMNACVRCASPATELHHRRRRRDGGHGTENCVAACLGCHQWFHSHPADARDCGWIVSAYDDNPAETPMKCWYGWVLLDSDGVASLVDAPA